jgi:hypothetical protein
MNHDVARLNSDFRDRMGLVADVLLEFQLQDFPLWTAYPDDSH